MSHPLKVAASVRDILEIPSLAPSGSPRALYFVSLFVHSCLVIVSALEPRESMNHRRLELIVVRLRRYLGPRFRPSNPEFRRD